jgi:hypothetical protein
LNMAASLTVSGNTLRVTNLTGHKLISGYPEGRRMWLNVKWYDASNQLLREDGGYGPIAVSGIPGVTSVKTIVNPSHTRIYEAHMAMTQDWAATLLTMNKPANLPLSFDRTTGAVTMTLGQLAAQPSGTYAETFHFVLNNHVAKDTRIPPFGMDYEEARKRNALPVPDTQFRLNTTTYRYWDDVPLNPPSGADWAEIQLLYQPTSWEYVQFLYLANDKSVGFLAAEGDKLLEAWLNTGMAEPHVMASATWGSPPPPTYVTPGVPQNLTAAANKRNINLAWMAGNPAPDGGYRIYWVQAGKLAFRAEVPPGTLTYTDSRLQKGTQYCYAVTAWTGDAESGPSNTACAMTQ